MRIFSACLYYKLCLYKLDRDLLYHVCQSNIQLSKVIIRLDNCMFYMTYFAHFQTPSVCNFHTLNKMV